MKPTMPMQAFPPGSLPGAPGSSPGGAPPGGGWGPPGGGQPPAAPPPEPKSKMPLFIGLGCGCLLLIGLCVGAGIFAASQFGPGEEVARTDLVLGQPYTVSWVQDGDQRYEAWLEVDVSYSAGYLLQGTATLNENGVPFGQYTVSENGEGSPVQERNTSLRTSWVFSNVGGNGSASGNVRFFPIPSRTAGATMTVTGTISGTPGTTGTVRIVITKRD